MTVKAHFPSKQTNLTQLIERGLEHEHCNHKTLDRFLGFILSLSALT